MDTLSSLIAQIHLAVKENGLAPVVLVNVISERMCRAAAEISELCKWAAKWERSGMSALKRGVDFVSVFLQPVSPGSASQSQIMINQLREITGIQDAKVLHTALSVSSTRFPPRPPGPTGGNPVCVCVPDPLVLWEVTLCVCVSQTPWSYGR